MSKNIEDIIYSEVAKQPIPFEIISMENLYKRFENHSVDLFSSHRIQFNALIIITEGNSTHNVDFKEYILSPGVLIPLVKGQVHFFKKELLVKGYIISFNEPFITEHISEKNLFHFLHLYHTSNLLIGEENIALLFPFIALLEQVQSSTNNNLKSDFVKTIFLSLLIQIKRLTIYQHEIFESRRFKDFIHFKLLVSQYYQESHNAKDYANRLAISYKYLNDICKEVTNKTAKAFIDSWLLLEIKRNISEKKYTTQEIGFKMGFPEPSNFIRFFKKHTGTTPNKFIKRYN
ncbi:AraC family transcriptional regulator [Aquimarina sp. AU119]|uniref:helix-turn-helix domain-containing protein n=1 Tax=Aquimarina sp. AU119 TaxID=2108528 RepID=UPI000D698040|nr:helix-turn-helix transcriptional regulator [Aquimarina sp. AU119]